MRTIVAPLKANVTRQTIGHLRPRPRDLDEILADCAKQGVADDADLKLPESELPPARMCACRSSEHDKGCWTLTIVAKRPRTEAEAAPEEKTALTIVSAKC